MSLILQLEAHESPSDPRESARQHTRLVTMNGAPTWMAALAEFAEFLGGIYGFDVKEKIILNLPDGLTTLRNQQLEEALAAEQF